MNWISRFFANFAKNDKHKHDENLVEFTQEQKEELVKCALSTCSEILISTMVMTNSHTHITGVVEMPDKSRFVLTFKKEENGK